MDDILIGKFFTFVLSVLGVSVGGVSFMFNGYKSQFDLYGRIGFGVMVIILAIVIAINTFRKQKNLHFCGGGCREKIPLEIAYCKRCSAVVEQDNSEPLGI